VSHSTLAGTGALVRLILRRDRVRLTVWIVSIVLLVLVSAASVIELYPTQESLDIAARASEENAAVLFLNGPSYGLDTIGGQVIFQIGSFGFVIMALMGMFLVGRHTRADEEAGRTELVRAAVVGRNAPVTAVLIVAGAAFAVLGALITLSLLSQDLATTGSVAYGAAMAAFGLFFACVTALVAQLPDHTRPVYGITAVILGISFVLRGIGDVGDGNISWLSPMGWAQGVRPFAGERWWPFALLVVGSAALVVGAFALLARRDLGGGLLRPRLGRPTASPSLSGPLGLAVRLQRGTLIGWTAALAATGISYGSIAQDVRDLIGDNESFEDIIVQGGGDLTQTFLATAALTAALIAGGFAVSSTLRLRSEETAGRAEPVLATATSRWRWAGSHLDVALVGSAILMLAFGLGLGVTYAIVAGDAGQVPELVGAALAFVPALWVLVGVATLLFGAFPRVSMVAWGAVAVCFVIGFLGQLLQLPQWAMNLSPFQHVPLVPVDGFALVPVAVLTVIAAALIGGGLVGFRRRDAGY
jgi:ABC-2 type transport system permease protein